MILGDIFWLFGAYLFGSIPFGLVVGYAFGVGDIRKLGSGNIGVTNVLRSVGKFAAFLALLGDGGKGLFFVLAYAFYGGGYLLGWVLLFCVLGHNFSIWLRFRGGKGVATSFGGLLMVEPVGLVVIGVWLLVFGVFRISSLAALVSFGVMPFLMVYFFPVWGLEFVMVYFVPFVLLSILVFVRHKDNIRRLLRGEEKKISFRKVGT